MSILPGMIAYLNTFRIIIIIELRSNDVTNIFTLDIGAAKAMENKQGSVITIIYSPLLVRSKINANC